MDNHNDQPTAEQLEAQLAEAKAEREALDKLEAATSGTPSKPKGRSLEQLKALRGTPEYRTAAFQKELTAAYDHANGVVRVETEGQKIERMDNVRAAKGTGLTTFQEFQEMRRSNPRRYYSAKVQKEPVALSVKSMFVSSPISDRLETGVIFKDRHDRH
jgi:hypothetical protein